MYVADYIEPGRDFPGVDQARQLAAESLRAAVVNQRNNVFGIQLFVS